MPNEAKSIDRSQARRSKQSAPTEANFSTEVICTEKHCVALNEAGRAEGKAKKPTARWGHNSKGSSGGTCFFGDDEDDSEG
jgi:hypothetical protein